MKKVIVVSSSLRKESCSAILAKSFAEGALSMGHVVDFISIKDMNLKYCIGCLSCQSREKCVLNDEMNGLYDKFNQADVLVFATPVYYYSICGQLKTFLDRLNPLFPRKNNFKDVYLLATAADEDDGAMDGSVTAIQGWIDCFDGVSLKAVFRGTGINDSRDFYNTTFIQQSFDLGKSI